MDAAEQIKNILNRIEKLEKAVFVQKLNKISDTKINTASGSLPNRILELRKADFFKQPETSQEVHAKLQPTYPCDLDRVNMALLRLFKKKLLRITSKTIKGKKLKAYVW